MSFSLCLDVFSWPNEVKLMDISVSGLSGSPTIPRRSSDPKSVHLDLCQMHVSLSQLFLGTDAA